MPRPVFHDVSPAATHAAAILSDRFAVRPLPLDGLPDLPSVVLVGGDVNLSAPPRCRVVALVDADDREWPEHWYAVLSAAPAPDTLRRTVRNAFADLDATAEKLRLAQELAELNQIGIRLSSERDPHALLDLILRKAREITQSDAGSLYLMEGEPETGQHLRFALAQNDSVAVPFATATLPLSHESVAGWVAREARPLILEDAYALPPGTPFRINRAFDASIGYRTKSMLVVPMQTPKGDVIGVLQLINCKPDSATLFASVEDVERHAVAFSERFVALASSLASQAAVALVNSRLYESIRQLFDGFVRASVVAIESRDPTTAGHSARVAELTLGLAEAADRCQDGPYASFRLTPDDAMELRYASLLHDFGKVGVQESVLVKAKKLAPEALERIRARIERLRLSEELLTTRRKLQYVLDKGTDGFDHHAAALDAELDKTLAQLDDALGRIIAVNEPTVMPQAATAEIAVLAARVVEDHRGALQPILTPEEAEVLSIARGSLTPAEFAQIRSHVDHSFDFLVQMPWTREFRRIPDIARGHHEKLNGSGYPRGLAAADIPVQSKMMAIADIFDALTAFDRPYKPPLPLDRALDILRAEARAGAIDPDLLALFIDARVWERIAAAR